MIRVAFTLIGRKNWTGGYNYLLNLLRVVQSELPGQIIPVLFAGTDIADAELAPFASIQDCVIVQLPVFNEDRRARLLMSGLTWGFAPSIKAALREQRIDVVFESAIVLGWRLNTPAIAWMPDFQHHFLPQLFSWAARWKRELGFRTQIWCGRTVMVSSKDSKSACQKLYPGVKERVHAVRFAVRPPVPMSDEDARGIANKYGLPEHYFFMPNQFWAHKNHLLVVQALHKLRQRGTPVTVVATGNQSDHRNPSHVPTLKAAVIKAGVASDLLMPGMIPYEDLMPLMQASAALLNPSLFEGWSTTVEEARAAGVPMILSDLAVHKEQAENQAIYFDRYCADSLAECLANFVSVPPLARQSMREAANKNAAIRVRQFATDFIELVKMTKQVSSS